MVERYEYLLDTRWACGLIVTNKEGIIIESAPIFKKFIGMNIENLSGKLTPLKIKT